MRKSRDNPDGKPSAYDRALGLLARREHSQRELRTKLAAKGYDKDESGEAVTALRDGSEQSDERYAEVLIRHRAAAGYGPRYIEAELKSHGIAVAPHRERLAEIDWLDVAARLVEKRYGRPKDRAGRDKAGQFLQRRGFTSDVIARALGR